MNKEYLQWIRHEFYLWKRDIKNNKLTKGNYEKEKRCNNY